MVKAVALLLLLGGAAIATAAVTTQWVIGSTSTVMLTPNSVASNSYTTTGQATYDNTISGTATGAGYTRCSFEAVLAFPANPSANAAVLLWILPSQDGTNYADTPSGSITTTPASLAIPVTQGQTTTRQIVFTQCPPGKFKLAAQLNGTGQTTNASGNAINMKQYTPQGN